MTAPVITAHTLDRTNDNDLSTAQARLRATQLAHRMVHVYHDPALLGRLGEEYTATILIANNWHILERNYRTRFGELDIIAQTPDHTLSFVEVKTRSSLSTGLPAQAVTPAKQKRLRCATRQWLLENPGRSYCLRLDVSSLIIRHGRVLLDYREGAF